MSNKLVPVQRMNVNGHFVTKWVRPDEVDGQGSAALNGSTAALTTPGVPMNVKWDNISAAKAKELVESVKEDIENPDKLWQNFDFLTGMLESKHSAVALAALPGVPVKLRDTWLNMHGVDIKDVGYYSSLPGADGFQAYQDTFGNYARAEERAAASVDWNNLDKDTASDLVTTLSEGLDDPPKVWNNFALTIGLLKSDQYDLTSKLMENEPSRKLRDAWLNLHGAKLSDRESYTSITGGAGYGMYRATYNAYAKAASDNELRQNNAATPVAPVVPERPDDLTSSDFQSQLDREILASRQQRNSAAGDRGPYDTVIDRAFDAVSEKAGDVAEAAGGVVGGFIVGQNGSTEGLNGTTISWSDLNPFKRRKK
jgi:hypothetical protein